MTMKFGGGNMENIKIFVEGIADDKFIRDYIKSTFEITLEKKHIHNCGGWKNIFEEDSVNEFIQCKFNGIKPLVIFDADTPEKENGGVKSRKKEIIEKLSALDIHIEESQIFLFPNDNSNGDLETLLEQIITKENTPIFDCWNGFEKCIERKSVEVGKGLTIPAKKAKIHTYCTVLLPDSNSGREKAKEQHRDYTNKSHWDIGNIALNPLKDFLHEYSSK